METHTGNPGSIYDRLQGLYQKDPAEFDRLSSALIQQALEAVPDELKARAYGIQRRVEHQLRKYKDPIARMNAMAEIFWQQFFEFHSVVHDPREVIENNKPQGAPAEVIPFKQN